MALLIMNSPWRGVQGAPWSPTPTRFRETLDFGREKVQSEPWEPSERKLLTRPKDQPVRVVGVALGCTIGLEPALIVSGGGDEQLEPIRLDYRVDYRVR